MQPTPAYFQRWPDDRRFVDGLTQEQIGRHLEVSQMQISRLLAGILARLRLGLGISDHAASA